MKTNRRNSFILFKIPIMKTEILFSTTLSRYQIRDDDIKPYLATAFIGPLREFHTGKYQCSRTDRVTSTPNTYIYVPGYYTHENFDFMRCQVIVDFCRSKFIHICGRKNHQNKSICDFDFNTLLSFTSEGASLAFQNSWSKTS